MQINAQRRAKFTGAESQAMVLWAWHSASPCPAKAAIRRTRRNRHVRQDRFFANRPGVVARMPQRPVHEFVGDVSSIPRRHTLAQVFDRLSWLPERLNITARAVDK